MKTITQRIFHSLSGYERVKSKRYLQDEPMRKGKLDKEGESIVTIKDFLTGICSFKISFPAFSENDRTILFILSKFLL